MYKIIYNFNIPGMCGLQTDPPVDWNLQNISDLQSDYGSLLAKSCIQYYANEICKTCANLAGFLASFIVDVIGFSCKLQLASCSVIVAVIAAFKNDLQHCLYEQTPDHQHFTILEVAADYHDHGTLCAANAIHLLTIANNWTNGAARQICHHPNQPLLALLHSP